MIDRDKRIEKEERKARTRRRIHVKVDPDNYDYYPETRTTMFRKE